MRVLIAALAVVCLIGLWTAVRAIGAHVPLDPNEGWNAYHTAAAMSGGKLYPDGLFFNNYPPLSFYIVGLVGWFTGDDIVAGRIVSLLSLFAVAAAIAAAARGMGAKRDAALFAALWFVLGMIVFTDYVAMDDPQLLGHAIAMGGLLLLLRGNVAAAATAMAAALFVKHNLIALPLGCAIWLALHDRRAAATFAAVGIACSLPLLLVFPHLSSPRLFSFVLLESSVGQWLLWGGPALAVLALLPLRADKYAQLCGLYAAASVLAGTVFCGGAGVDMNVWFDAAIAVSLGAALALSRFPAALTLAYILPLALGYWRADHDGPARADGDVAFLKAHPGPALCEMLSLCYWAGKPEEVDTFNLGQAYATHARAEAPLVKLLGAKYFRAVELDSLDDFTLGPRVKTALLANYRIDHEDDTGIFLVPR
jgi:hypothetical protein